jgi:hypothetical protein
MSHPELTALLAGVRSDPTDDTLRPVHTLDLSALWTWTDLNVRFLADGRALENVRTLRLGTTRLTAAGLAALRASPRLPRLAVIDARGPYIDAARAVERGLRSLNLRGVSLRGRPGNALADPESLPGLRRLVVSRSGLSANHLRGLTRRFGAGLVFASE